MQAVASVDDQVSVDWPPAISVAGLAVNETVGIGTTATAALACALPPAPLQDRLKVVVAVNGPTLALPEAALDPDQPLAPPLAVQPVALVELQLSVAVPPEATDDGLALNEMVGAGVALGTVTVTELEALPPPLLVHVSV